jgi:sulfate permease, SulP family
VEARLFFPSLRGYQRSWLGPDVLAGLTLVAIAVPEQMATARLAAMPAVTGLYVFLAGSLLFAVFGRSHHLSIGADSTIAPVFLVGVAAIAAVGTPRYQHLVSFLALMVGALVVAVGLLRLGWISEFLSTPVVLGVLGGIAVDIAVRQLPVVLGLPGGGTTTIGQLRRVAEQIGHVNGWALGIAVGVLVVIVAMEHIDRRIPGPLIGLVASVVVVETLGLTSHGVVVLGSIHGGLPSFGVPSPSWSDIRHLLAPALTVAFICVVQTAATERASERVSSADDPTPADFNRDLVALGAGSVVAGLSGSFAVNASPPRTEVVTTSGGRSQLTSVVAGVLVLGLVLVATGVLNDLPTATLGAILLYVASRMFRGRDLRSVLRFDRLEFGLAILTLLAVSLVGIEQGIVVAMLLCLADRIRRAARPRDVILGREPGTDHWIAPDVGRATEEVPGIIVYLLYAPLWYGNADYIRSRVREVLDTAAWPVHAFVLDANGMSDIDYTGTRTLRQLADELHQRGIRMGIARASHLVHHDLKHGGLLQAIGPERLFPSVEEAAAALTRPS